MDKENAMLKSEIEAWAETVAALAAMVAKSELAIQE